MSGGDSSQKGGILFEATASTISLTEKGKPTACLICMGRFPKISADLSGQGRVFAL